MRRCPPQHPPSLPAPTHPPHPLSEEEPLEVSMRMCIFHLQVLAGRLPPPPSPAQPGAPSPRHAGTQEAVAPLGPGLGGEAPVPQTLLSPSNLSRTTLLPVYFLFAGNTGPQHWVARDGAQPLGWALAEPLGVARSARGLQAVAECRSFGGTARHLAMRTGRCGRTGLCPAPPSRCASAHGGQSPRQCPGRAAGPGSGEAAVAGSGLVCSAGAGASLRSEPGKDAPYRPPWADHKHLAQPDAAGTAAGGSRHAQVRCPSTLTPHAHRG